VHVHVALFNVLGLRYRTVYRPSSIHFVIGRSCPWGLRVFCRPPSLAEAYGFHRFPLIFFEGRSCGDFYICSFFLNTDQSSRRAVFSVSGRPQYTKVTKHVCSYVSYCLLVHITTVSDGVNKIVLNTTNTAVKTDATVLTDHRRCCISLRLSLVSIRWI
jgi:hypothetical protein